jgi:hypothetical protein
MKPSNGKRGRPRTVWDRERVETIIAALKSGNSMRDAAELARISYDTLARKVGEDENFAGEVRRARLTLKAAALNTIAGAIHDGNASSAAWYLRAAWPADFAPSSSTEAPAPIGGPYPELKMAEKIRGSDEAMKLMHDALAVSIADWQRKRKEKPDE